MASYSSSPKVDWVADRLDSLRSAAFRLGQSERAGEEARRKASFGLLDSKAQHAHKALLYKRIDATQDSMWIRFVYLAQSTFKRTPPPGPAETPAVAHAHSSLIRVSAITLEVRQAVFDLLDLLCKLKLTLGGSLAVVQSADFSAKTLNQRLYGLVQLQDKLCELAAELKIHLAGQRLDSQVAEVRSGDGLRDVPTQRKTAATQQLPPLVELPILLLSERLAQHYSEADRESLFTLVPQLRDLRGSLHILYQLRCDDAAVSLALADSLGETYFRLLQHPTLRDLFLAPIAAAFQAARAAVWSTLRQDHEVDLTATAQAATKQQTLRQKQYEDAGRRLDLQLALPIAAVASSPTSSSSFAFKPIQQDASIAQTSPSEPSQTPPPTLLSPGMSDHSTASNVLCSPRLSPLPFAREGTAGEAAVEEEEEEVIVSASPVAPVSVGQPAADDEWVEARSGDNIFYYSKKTGQSSWSKPERAPPATAAAALGTAVAAVPTLIPPLSSSAHSTPDTAGHVASSAPTAGAFSSSDEPPLLSSLPVAPACMIPFKACAFPGCQSARFAGKPYCATHLRDCTAHLSL